MSALSTTFACKQQQSQAGSLLARKHSHSQQGRLGGHLLRESEALHVCELGCHVLMLSTVDPEVSVCLCHCQDAAPRYTGERVSNTVSNCVFALMQ